MPNRSKASARITVEAESRKFVNAILRKRGINCRESRETYPSPIQEVLISQKPKPGNVFCVFQKIVKISVNTVQLRIKSIKTVPISMIKISPY